MDTDSVRVGRRGGGRLAISSLLLAGLVVGCSPPSGDAVGAAATTRTAEASRPTLVVYKSPSCICCHKWVEHLQKAGFRVEVHDTTDLAGIKAKAGIGSSLASCHTAFVGRYAIEGHVPAADVERLLREHPDVAGLTAPGMPNGAPGMESLTRDKYDVLAFQRDGATSKFATHP